MPNNLGGPVPWPIIIRQLETLAEIYELAGGYPPPHPDEILSEEIDAQCDAFIRASGENPPAVPPTPELAKWMRVRALAALNMAQSRSKTLAAPEGPFSRAFQFFLIEAWHRGLRYWWPTNSTILNRRVSSASTPSTPENS